MEILDENGRLFGLVNVVDLVVVLVVLVLVVGGIAFVLDAEEEPGEPTTTEAQLVFGGEPGWLVTHLESGEEVNAGGDIRVQILDVHVGSSPESGSGGVLHVELTGPVDTVTAGDDLYLTGERYRLDTRVADTGDVTHETGQSEILLETTVSKSLAAELEPGELTLAGNEIGAIHDVTAVETTDSTSRVHLAVELETVTVRGDTYVGNTSIARGKSLQLGSAEYNLQTTIISVEPGPEEPSHIRVWPLDGQHSV